MTTFSCPICSARFQAVLGQAGNFILCPKCCSAIPVAQGAGPEVGSTELIASELLASFDEPKPQEQSTGRKRRKVQQPSIQFFCHRCDSSMGGPAGERRICRRCGNFSVAPDQDQTPPPPHTVSFFCARCKLPLEGRARSHVKCRNCHGLNEVPGNDESPQPNQIKLRCPHCGVVAAGPADRPLNCWNCMKPSINGVDTLQESTGSRDIGADAVSVLLGLLLLVGVGWLLSSILSTSSTPTSSVGHDHHPAANQVERMLENEARRQGANMTPGELKAA